MERVSISQLKDQLSAYLKKVQAGDTVLVMDRDRPIARIEAVDPALDEDAHYQRLVAAGLVTPPKRPFSADLIQPVDLGPEARVLDALLEERRESR
jgi:antitoxin (DNA-binding transcriptional repressor) of toxin-antitoxin stability system